MFSKRINEKIWRLVDNNRYVLSLLWHANKKYVAVEIIFAILGCLRTIIPVILTKLLIDMISGQESLGTFLWAAFFCAAITYSLTLVFRWHDTSFRPIETQKIRNYMRVKLLNRAKQVDYMKFDDSSFFDLYTRCISEGENRCIDVLSTICEFITACFSLIGISAIIFTLSPLLIVISVILLVITLEVSSKQNKIGYEEYSESVSVDRENDYIQRLFYQKQFAKEIKVFSLNALLLKRQKKVSDSKINVIRKFKGTKIAWHSVSSLVSVGQNVGFIAFLGAMVILGRITMGDYTALNTAAYSFIGQLSGILNIIPNVQNHSLYISDFRKFMEEGQEKRESSLPAPDRFTSLELQNASFTYEGSGFSLKNLSMTIRKGEKIAIVGENGSGKSTLIKMLMNLYHPESGKICYNGQSYDEYDDEALHSAFGAVFQDIQSYDMTVAEYVLLREYTEADYTLVWDALKKCGLYDFVQKLPMGLETHISTEFDPEGMELSGGQLQKLAIARIYAGNYDFIILDEPTSALDPRSEYEFNKTLFDIAKDKTVIFISHRLSTTRFADKIYLMDGGRIVEEGSHDELMQIEKGHYRELFDMQAEYYITNSEQSAT